MQAKQLWHCVAWFMLIDGILYWWNSAGPFLRCLGEQEADYVLREIHKGFYGSYVGGHTLARKTLLSSYLWPTMEKDAK